MQKFVTGLGIGGAILYPAVVYFGLRWYEPRVIVFFLALLLLLRALAGRKWLATLGATEEPARKRQATAIQTVAALLLMCAIMLHVFLSNTAEGLRLYPVVINVLLFASFATSLLFPPSAIERLARIRDPALSLNGINYTRKLTRLWCGFFLINGLVALYTALWSSMETWLLYNGLVAYLLIGVLLGSEYMYRRFILKP